VVAALVAVVAMIGYFQSQPCVHCPLDTTAHQPSTSRHRGDDVCHFFDPFVDQTESDGVLDDVATMIGCTRSNLHVVASDKGLVVGRITFYEDGDFIDCTKMGVGGKAIPPYIDKIENVESDAEFILLVEKEAAYMRMAVSESLCRDLQIVLLVANSVYLFCIWIHQ
jgi:DNA topoisomerase VI subunit A